MEKYIVKFSRQILEGLAALKTIGFRYPQLSTSNIMLDANTNCKLSELEDIILGVKPHYLDYMRPLNEKLEEEVICFGHVLYEMVTGIPLDSKELHGLDDFPCPPAIRQILERIFDENQETPVTIDSLLNESIFASVQIGKANRHPLVSEINNN